MRDYCMLEKIGTGSYATVYKALKKVRAVPRAPSLPLGEIQVRFGPPSAACQASIVFICRKKRNAPSRVKLHAFSHASSPPLLPQPRATRQRVNTRYRRKLDSVCIALACRVGPALPRAPSILIQKQPSDFFFFFFLKNYPR